MARYDDVQAAHGFKTPPPRSRTAPDAIDELVALAASSEARERQVAVKNLCTCHVQADDDRAWAALLALFDDASPRVRSDVLHAITDSTPASRTEAVVAALEGRYSDPDLRLRRRIRRTLAHYRRTGEITDAPR